MDTKQNRTELVDKLLAGIRKSMLEHTCEVVIRDLLHVVPEFAEYAHRIRDERTTGVRTVSIHFNGGLKQFEPRPDDAPGCRVATGTFSFPKGAVDA